MEPNQIIQTVQNILTTKFHPERVEIFDATPDGDSCSDGRQLRVEMHGAQWPEGMKTRVARHREVIGGLQGLIETGDVHAVSLFLK